MPLGTSSAAPAGDGAHSPSTYEWSEQLSDGTLLAVGGGAPSTVHLWNLQQEICIEQVMFIQSLPPAPLLDFSPTQSAHSRAFHSQMFRLLQGTSCTAVHKPPDEPYRIGSSH